MGRAVLQASGNDHHNQHHDNFDVDNIDNFDDHRSDHYFNHHIVNHDNFNIDDESKHNNLDLNDDFSDDDVITPRSVDRQRRSPKLRSVWATR